MDQKKKEFHKLTRGKMTIDEYQRKFLELSRYAEDDVCTDARKQTKFCEGLHPNIKLTLLSKILRTLRCSSAKCSKLKLV